MDVVLERGSDAQTVAAAIGRALPPGLMVTAPAQRRADLDRWLGSLRLALRALSLVGLVAAFLIAFNRLTTAFERRAWQVGVLRAAGVRRRTLWLLLLEEGLLVGVLGAALGIPLGIGLARLLLPLIAASAALHYKLFAPEAVLTLPATSLALAAGTGLGASLLAAVLPAWRVSRVAVVETLRGRGVEQEGARPRWMRVAVRATLGGLTAAVVAQAATRSATYGLLATGLIAVGTALAAAPLVRVASSGLARGCRGLAGPGSRFAVCTLGRNPRRSALTVATFGVGLGCVIWFWTVATSFERSLVESLTAAVRAELVVTSSHTTAGYLEAPLSAEVQAELAQVAGVAEVAGMRVIDWPHAGTRIAIDAFDPQYFTDGFGRWPLRGERIAGVWGAVARGEAVIVSANFAMNLNARVGDTVVLGTPSGPLPLLVGGLTPAFESPAGTLAMSRVLFSRLWHDHQVTRIAVRTALGVRVAAVRAAIARALGQAHDLRILSAGELIGHYAAQVRRAFAPVHILGALVLVVTLLGLADALAAGVQDRRRELGTLRALGVRRGYVGRMIVVEALVLGGLGFLLALAAGFSLAVLWVEATLPYLLGWVVDLHLPYAQVPAAGAVSVAVCLSAALVPARRAARLQPLRALRDE